MRVYSLIRQLHLFVNLQPKSAANAAQTFFMACLGMGCAAHQIAGTRAIRGTQGLWVHLVQSPYGVGKVILLFIIVHYFTCGKAIILCSGPPYAVGSGGCSVRSRNGYRYIRTFNSCLWCQGFTHASDPGEEPHQFLCGKAVEMGSNQQKQCIIWPDFWYVRLPLTGCSMPPNQPDAPDVAPTTGYPMSYKKPPCTPPGVPQRVQHPPRVANK